MSILQQSQKNDSVLPFQLEKSAVRGRFVRLDHALSELLRQHQYPANVEALVAEMAVLTSLIGQSIKLRWKLSLQVQMKGALRMIATDYYAPENDEGAAEIRAYASFDRDKIDADLPPEALLGEGYFAILIDQGDGTAPYQGITPLSPAGLAASAEAYFAQSEQLPTRFAIGMGRSKEGKAQEHWIAGAIMLQRLPGEGGEAASPAMILAGDEAEDWRRANFLLDTVDPLELTGPSIAQETVLLRLFHEENPRVFPVRDIQFGCPCSAERVRSSLSIYSAKEIMTMIDQNGQVTADCQFCGAHYQLDPAILGFEGKGAVDVVHR